MASAERGEWTAARSRYTIDTETTRKYRVPRRSRVGTFHAIVAGASTLNTAANDTVGGMLL